MNCAATPDVTEEQDELDQIAIDNFLDALAEVAMAIASRRASRKLSMAIWPWLISRSLRRYPHSSVTSQ